MSTPDPDDFDAPALRAAVHHCWGAERAPPMLRARIEQACAAGRRPNRFAAVRWGLAIAAGVAVAVAVPRFVARPPPPAGGGGTVGPLAVSALPVWDEVVRNHDQCLAKGDVTGMPVLHRGQDTVIAAALRRELARPVLVCRPGDPGWDCRRAGICTVGDRPTGHVVFVKQADALSIFSLPHGAAPTVRDGGEFELTRSGHRIVGFAERGAVFALVGSGPAPDADLPHLRRMRGRMETQVVAGQTWTGGDVVASR